MAAPCSPSGYRSAGFFRLSLPAFRIARPESNTNAVLPAWFHPVLSNDPIRQVANLLLPQDKIASRPSGPPKETFKPRHHIVAYLSIKTKTLCQYIVTISCAPAPLIWEQKEPRDIPVAQTRRRAASQLVRPASGSPASGRWRWDDGPEPCLVQCHRVLRPHRTFDFEGPISVPTSPSSLACIFFTNSS